MAAVKDKSDKRKVNKAELIQLVNAGKPYADIALQFDVAVETIGHWVIRLKKSGELPDKDRRYRKAATIATEKKKQPTYRAKTIHKNKKIGLDERVCPICGKTFFCYPQWVYKIRNANYFLQPVCTYSCMRAAERRKNGNNKYN